MQMTSTIETNFQCQQYQTLLWTCVAGVQLQYVYNHYAKFEYNRVTTVEVTDCTNQTPAKHFGWKTYLSSTSLKKMRISNVHKIGGAHLQCVTNHFAKFLHKAMKSVGVTVYTN